MYLLFDCSGIEKPKDWNAPFSDTFSWPRLLHISWIVLDKDFKPKEDFDFVVKADGFKVTEKIKRNCRLDKDDIEAKSVPLETVLNQFSESLKLADYVLSFNQKFNESVLAAEYLRLGINHELFMKERSCLMQESTFFCKIPNTRGGYKWPTLTQLHAICFQKGFTPPGNARADVIAASRCFIMLMKVKALDDLFEDEEE